MKIIVIVPVMHNWDETMNFESIQFCHVPVMHNWDEKRTLKVYDFVMFQLCITGTKNISSLKVDMFKTNLVLRPSYA